MRPVQRTPLAIVGAGPGGLTLAHYLRLRGFSHFVLIERAGQIGGKSDSLDLEDMVVEMGTCYATSAYRDVLNWMREQGFPFRTLRRSTVDGETLRDYVNQAEGTSLVTQVGIYLAKRAHLLSRLRRCPQDPSALAEAALPAETWLRQNGLAKIMRMMYRAVTSLGYGVLNEVSIYQAMVWVDHHTILSGATGRLIMPSQGWTRFWEILARGLDIRLSHEITHIERGPAGALIHFAGGQALFAEKLVCTIPMDDWTRLVSNPTDDERALAGAITWKGYSTSLIVAETWFTDEDSRSFSSAFLPGSYPGQLISARHEGYSRDFGGHLYVTGQLPGDHTPGELRTFLDRDLADKGARLVNVVNSRLWRYFPHMSLDAIRGGMIRRMQEMQGGNGTWYTGATFSHESVSNISRFNRRLSSAIGL